MATFWPTKALIRVDFPVFGRPIIATNPDFIELIIALVLAHHLPHNK